MAENGLGVAFPFRHYEDYGSLKKNVNNDIGDIFIGDNTYEIIITGNQASTGADARISSTNGGETVISSPLSKTEETWVFAFAADDETANGLTITMVYDDNSGDSHTTYGIVTAADNSVEAPFIPAVADGYAMRSLSISGAVTTQDLGVGPTGDLTRGIISNTAVAATEAQLHGVGDLWVRGESNHADSVDEDCFVDWMTPWGEVKLGGIATTDAVDGTVEERCFESDGTTTIKDAWYIIMFWAKLGDLPTVNSGFFLLTDDAVANVDGSGNDVYGVIDETEVASKHVSFTAAAGCQTWLGHIHAYAPIGNALGDFYHLKIHFTPKGESYEKVLFETFSQEFDEDFAFPLEPDTEVYVEIADTAGASTFHLDMIILSAREV